MDDVASKTCQALMYGVNRVFIATDSTTILSEIKNFEPEFEFIYLDMDRGRAHSECLPRHSLHS